MCAAFLHAGWNALVKNSSDKFASMSSVMIGHFPFAVLLILYSPLPLGASWPYVIAGAVLHTGYQLFLLFSYRLGDLTQVYPIARGSAPLIIAFVSVTFLGVKLGAMQLLGVLVIGSGLMSLVIVRGKQGLGNRAAGLMAFGTGCFIASYSLVDGTGARLAATAFGFYGWMSVINSVMFVAIISVIRPGSVRGAFANGRRMMLLGGGGSLVAYSLVTWAFTQAPIALVSALRETSIIFALLIGVMFLKERVDLAKILSVSLALIGAVLLRVSR
jgi:drug/metabolite transporter (DMT)-like permease